MMRIVVLGSGGSTPSVERNPPSLALRVSGSVYLFDCGEGTQREMMKAKISYGKIKAVFITHLHADHYLGLYGLFETLLLNGRTEPLLVCGPPGIRRLFPTSPPFVHFHDIDESFVYKEEFFSVRTFRTKHASESFGFVFQEKEKRNFIPEKAERMGVRGTLFKELEKSGSLSINGKIVRLEDVSIQKPGKKIAYSGDTPYDPSLCSHFSHADILFHDSAFLHAHEEEAREKKHSTAKQAALIAAEAKVNRLFLIHISARYSGESALELEKEAQSIFPHSVLTYDGMEIQL